MLNVVDDESQSGNLDDLTKSLREEAAALASGNKAPSEAAAPAKDNPPEDDVPEKFRGKSVREVAEAYKQLESQYGRMANDLGQQRAITDRILNLRRDNDLRQNGVGVTQPETPKIKATDLAEDPTGSIEKVVDARLARDQQAAATRAQEESRNAAAHRLVRDHPDYQDFVNNADFAKWLDASPIRKRAAAAVQQGDFDTGNDLLTEYKAHRKAMAKQDEDTNLDAARAASLESGSRGNGEGTKKGGKIYNRADLLRLQISNPDLYYSDEYQSVIMKAYAEKRVK